MMIVGGNLAEYEAIKKLSVSEYLVKLEYKIKEQKQKEKEHGR